CGHLWADLRYCNSSTIGAARRSDRRCWFLQGPGAPRVFGRRWIVLFLFSVLGFLQGLIWNTWGPIQNSARAAYNFTGLDIALLVLWGPIGFLPCFLFMWLMDNRGLRVTVLLTSLLTVLGSGLRCDERATATALASMLSYLGAACSFLIGPLVDRIEEVLYAEFGVTSLLFAAILAYFPSRPPVPPSVAAASYRNSICRLLGNVRFLLLLLAYAVPLGFYSGWSGVLDLILTPAQISQVDAGWIDFWSLVGGCILGIGVARLADFIRGTLKLILVVLFSGATLSATWFTLTFMSNVTHLPITTATLYTSCILLGVFLNGTVPIFFELFVETVYPVPEGIACGLVTFLNNVFMGVLLLLLTFYHTDLSWLNWCLTGSSLLSLLFILCFRESYDRLYLDWPRRGEGALRAESSGRGEGASCVRDYKPLTRHILFLGHVTKVEGHHCGSVVAVMSLIK
uniref:Solute carrier family 49 member 4 n=1 Tax=Leptobrachium leishanense TaxID=445787 RepID=A0A8C5LXK6_9ANUR